MFESTNGKIKDMFPEKMKYLINIEDGELTTGSGKRIVCSCPICKTEKSMFVYNLIKFNFSCDYCNTLEDKRPDLIKFLINEDDKKLKIGSGKKIKCKCPDCGNEKEKIVRKLVEYGLGCTQCSNTISTSERFLLYLLKDNNFDVITQYSPTWANKKRYDFYIPSLNLIIETNGIQHYQEVKRGRSLENEQKNDEFKEKMAKENGIEHYIIIDCSKPEKKILSENIIKELKN